MFATSADCLAESLRQTVQAMQGALPVPALAALLSVALLLICGARGRQ